MAHFQPRNGAASAIEALTAVQTALDVALLHCSRLNLAALSTADLTTEASKVVLCGEACPVDTPPLEDGLCSAVATTPTTSELSDSTKSQLQLSQTIVSEELEWRFSRLRASLGLPPVCVSGPMARVLVADLIERLLPELRRTRASSLQLDECVSELTQDNGDTGAQDEWDAIGRRIGREDNTGDDNFASHTYSKFQESSGGFSSTPPDKMSLSARSTLLKQSSVVDSRQLKSRHYDRQERDVIGARSTEKEDNKLEDERSGLEHKEKTDQADVISGEVEIVEDEVDDMEGRDDENKLRHTEKERFRSFNELSNDSHFQVELAEA
ncbi:unnamed protein product [Protopolystoma xenopodis]|uniref:Uncharacterized protein n=1 Tax=Protopolystoma xenopodis TaxID=117903 RepID=A0A3S5CBJ8_9PLAT|nr:unnamed protein product [Protopolystoma xenopodis]